MRRTKELAIICGMLFVGTYLAWATVSSQTTKIYFTCNGSATTFSCTGGNKIPCFASTDIDVYLRNNTTGAETLQALTTNYTVTALNNDYTNGFTVTMNTAPASVNTLVVKRSIALTQEVNLIRGRAIPQEPMEKTLDRQMLALQDLEEEVSRSIRARVTDPAVDFILPSTIDTAGKYLAVASDGLSIVPTEGTTSDIVVSSYMETLVDDATPAAARTTLGLSNSIICVEAYGASGTGDETTELQAAFAAAENRILMLEDGVTYTVTDVLQMLSGCTLEGNGATLEFNMPTAIKCLRLGNYCTVRNLTIKQISSTASGDGFDQACIFIGTDDGASGTGTHDVLIENIVVYQSASRHYIAVAGDAHDIVIRNIYMPASTTAYIGILCHWSAEDDDWESNGSNHPHNIVIENIKCDGLKQAVDPGSSFVVFLSGCYNVTVRNVNIDTAWGAVRIQPGTPGSDQCQTYQEELILTGITVENITGKDVVSGLAATWSSDDNRQTGGGDNIFGHDANITFRNCKLYGILTEGNGGTVTELSGVTFEHCDFQNYGQGFRITDSVAGDGPGLVDRTVIRDCHLEDINYSGINIGAPNSADILIENTGMRDVNKSGTAAGTTDRNFIHFDTDRTTIRKCRLGLSASEAAFYGVYVGAAAVDSLIEDVHIIGMDDSGTGFHNGGTRTTFIRPRNDNTTATFASGIIPVMTDTDATPSVLGIETLLSFGTTTITDFDDGVEDQVFTFMAETSITITDGANIFLDGSANWAMTDTDTLTLKCKSDGLWYEISRSDSGA